MYISRFLWIDDKSWQIIILTHLVYPGQMTTVNHAADPLFKDNMQYLQSNDNGQKLL